MHDLIAFALTSAYAGTVDIVKDGEPQTVPRYGGGLLYVGDGDIDVAAELEKGDGRITVQPTDAPLIELLDAYPPLERVPTVDGAHVVSPYDRVTDQALEHQARLRGLLERDEHPHRDALIGLLAQDDAKNLASVVEQAAAVPAPAPGPVPGPVPLEDQKRPQLVERAKALELPAGGTAEELRERIAEREAAIAAGEPDTDAGDGDSE